MIKRESTHQWELIPVDDDPASYDPTFEDFACIVDAFGESVASPRVLLDDIALPSDGGERITAATMGGTAGVVSDGSFDPEGRHGSSSFTMVATQDDEEECLDGSNYVIGYAEDKSLTPLVCSLHYCGDSSEAISHDLCRYYHCSRRRVCLGRS